MRTRQLEPDQSLLLLVFYILDTLTLRDFLSLHKILLHKPFKVGGISRYLTCKGLGWSSSYSFCGGTHSFCRSFKCLSIAATFAASRDAQKKYLLSAKCRLARQSGQRNDLSSDSRACGLKLGVLLCEGCACIGFTSRL